MGLGRPDVNYPQVISETPGRSVSGIRRGREGRRFRCLGTRIGSDGISESIMVGSLVPQRSFTENK